jgi:hypothetical protein
LWKYPSSLIVTCNTFLTIDLIVSIQRLPFVLLGCYSIAKMFIMIINHYNC